MNQSPTPNLQGSPDLVYAMIQAPSAITGERGTVFAARASGLYRSVDGGITWQYTYRSLLGEVPLATTSVVVSPNFSENQTVFAGVSGAVLASQDGGQTWQPVSLPTPAPLVTSLAVALDTSPTGEALFAATAEDGVFCSNDHGRSWTAWNFGLLDMSVIAIAVSPLFSQDHTVYAGTSSGLFVSANRGHSWREAAVPFEFDAVISLAAANGPGGQPVLFAGTENYGLFHSPDGGETWRPAATGYIHNPVNGILLASDFHRAPEIVLLLGRALLISRDGGETWTDWLRGRLPAEEEITALCAPQGFTQGAPLLLGGLNGIYSLKA